MVHGLIHSTFEGFLRRVYGDVCYAKIEALEAHQFPLEAAPVEDSGGRPQHFEEKCPYADSLFFSHVRSTALVVHASEEEVLYQYGRFFLQNASEQGFYKLLTSFSKTFPGFLANLNNLHLYLSLGIPTMQTPDFRVEKVTSTSLELHYRSVRPGLGPMVEGLVHALAEFFFHDLPITMTWLKGRANKSCDHEVWHLTFPEDMAYTSHVEQLKQATENAVFATNAATFYHLHPYHFVLDTDCRIIQAGSVLQRVVPSLVQGSRASDHFDIVAPLMCPHSHWTFKEMASHTGLCFVLKGRTRKLELKGQFVRTGLQPAPYTHTQSSHATSASKSHSTTQGYPACPTLTSSSSQGTHGPHSQSITTPLRRKHSSAGHHLPYTTSLSARSTEPQNGAQLTCAGSDRTCPVASSTQATLVTDLIAHSEGLPRLAAVPRQSPPSPPHPLPTSTSNASSCGRVEGSKEERGSPKQSASIRSSSCKPTGFFKKLGLGSGKGNPFKLAYQSMTSKPIAASASTAHKDTNRAINDEGTHSYHLGGSVAYNGNKTSGTDAQMKPQHMLHNTVSNGVCVPGNSDHTSLVNLSKPLDHALPEPLPHVRASADVGQEVLLFVGTLRMLNLDDMRAYDMMLDDVPMHDMTADVLVMSERIEADNLLRKRLQEERAVLEERAEKLAAQNAAQEEAYLRIGEALQEALVQRDEHQGAPKYKGFHVQTPAEKALELLDQILHGIHPSMREVLEVRDSILMAGTDLRVPLRLGDQVVQELGQSTPVDTEVAAALTQLLVAGGPRVSRWSASETLDTTSSEPEPESFSSQNNARPSNGNNLGFSACNRAFSSTLETFTRPFACGQDSMWPSGREKQRTTTISGAYRQPSRRLTESMLSPLVGPERSSKLQHSESAARTGSNDGGDGGSRPPVRRSSSFSAGENSAHLEHETLLQQLHEQVQQRSSAGATPLVAAPSNIRSGNAMSSLMAERVHDLLSSQRLTSHASGTSTSTSVTQAQIGHNATGTSCISSRASDHPLIPHGSSASGTHSTTHITLECSGSPTTQTSAPLSSAQISSIQGDHAGASESSAFLLNPTLQSGPSCKLSAFCTTGRSPPSTASELQTVISNFDTVESAPTSSTPHGHSFSGKNSAAQPGNNAHNMHMRGPQRSWTGPLLPSNEVSSTASGGGIAWHRSAHCASTGESAQVRVAGPRRPPARSTSLLLKRYRALGAKQQPILEEGDKQPIQEELKKQPIQEGLGRGHGKGQASTPLSKKADPSYKEGPGSSPQVGSPLQARESLIRKLSDGLSGLAEMTEFGRAGKGAFVQTLGARSSSKTKAHALSACPAQDHSRHSTDSAPVCSIKSDTARGSHDPHAPPALRALEARRALAEDGKEGREEAGRSSGSPAAGRRCTGLPVDSDVLLTKPNGPQHPACHANALNSLEREEFMRHQTSGTSAHEDGSSSAPLPSALSVKRPANGGRAARKPAQACWHPSAPVTLTTATVHAPGAVEQLMKPPSDPLLLVLAKVDDWTFDAFELDAASNGRPLSALAFALLSRGSLISHFKIHSIRLARFLLTVEDRYINNPYHNRIHAADVLRTLHVMMSRGGIRQAMHTTQDIALLAVYMAAVVHDFEHKGVNNDFLVKTLDPLALFYNDRSPMENHHTSAAFRLLLWDEQCAAFANAQSKVRDALRKIVVDTVLATDMKQHFNITSHFNTKIPTLLGHVKSETPRQSKESLRRSMQRVKMGEQAANNAAANNHTNNSNDDSCYTLPLPLPNNNANNSSSVFHAQGTRPDSLEHTRPVGPISNVSGTPHQHPHTHPPQQQGHSSNQGLHPAHPCSHESSSIQSGSLQGASGDALVVQPQHMHKPGSTHSSSQPPQHAQGSGPATSSSLSPLSRNSVAAVMGPLSGPSSSMLPPPPPPQQHSHQQGHKSPAEHLSSCANSLHSTMELNIMDEELRTLVLQMALKCADLGHLTHTRDVHRRWVLLLEEEMFRQGDAEKAHGLPVSPLMDRAKGGISKSQAGFFSIVVLPQLESFCKVFPGCMPMLDQAQDNYQMWLEESKKPERKSLAKE